MKKYLFRWLVVPAAVIAMEAFAFTFDNLSPIPPGAQVTLETDQTEYFLGDSVLLHFTLRNTGREPFQYRVGGDYRGVDRQVSFKFRVFDAEGNELADPFPASWGYGGLATAPTLAPGGDAVFSLPLFRYWHFDQPGTYTIRVHHDFGWIKGEDAYPEAELTLTLKMPDAAEAEHVIGQLENLPGKEENYYSLASDKRLEPFADWSVLRYGVYLQPLLKRVRRRPQPCIEGIGAIPTIEATRALIDLAGEPDFELRRRAADLLSDRVHGHYPDVYLLRYTPQIESYAAMKKARSWDPGLRDPVRALGKELIRNADPAMVTAGARLLLHVAQPEDAGAILEALDKALAVTHSPRTGEANPLDFPSPLRELLDAAFTVCRRGYRPGDNLSGDAQILVYFHWLSIERPDPMPADWFDRLEAFGPSDSYAIRQRAIASIPPTVPDDCVEYALHAFEDSDTGVLLATCELAMHSGRREFLQPVLEVLQTTQQEWVMRAAGNAACMPGGRYEASLICANRLPEDGFLQLSLDVLAQNIEGLGGGSSGRSDLSRGERLALRDAWLRFLSQNAAALKSGKRFHYQDPAVRPALFGRARTYYPDGSEWPQ